MDAGGRNPPDLNSAGVHEQQMERKPVRGKCLRLLTSSIKKAQCVGVVADHDSDGVVIKHLGRQFFLKKKKARSNCNREESYSWDILAGKLVCRV